MANFSFLAIENMIETKPSVWCLDRMLYLCDLPRATFEGLGTNIPRGPLSSPDIRVCSINRIFAKNLTGQKPIGFYAQGPTPIRARATRPLRPLFLSHGRSRTWSTCYRKQISAQGPCGEKLITATCTLPSLPMFFCCRCGSPIPPYFVIGSIFGSPVEFFLYGGGKQNIDYNMKSDPHKVLSERGKK